MKVALRVDCLESLGAEKLLFRSELAANQRQELFDRMRDPFTKTLTDWDGQCAPLAPVA